MPVELPKRNKRGLPITLSIGALAASAIVTFAIQPKEEPAPRMQVVGVVSVRSADPTSTGSRVPDPLEIPKKKKAKKKTTVVSSGGGGGGGAAAAPNTAVASSGTASSGYTGSGATASRSSGTASTQRSSAAPKRSSGSSGTSAAEAEFGPG